MFPKLDIVGWYATGEDVQEADMLIHRKVCIPAGSRMALVQPLHQLAAVLAVVLAAVLAAVPLVVTTYQFPSSTSKHCCVW